MQEPIVLRLIVKLNRAATHVYEREGIKFCEIYPFVQVVNIETDRLLVSPEGVRVLDSKGV